MKKLLVLFALIALFGCENEYDTCWLCSVERYVRVNIPNPGGAQLGYYYEWQYDGIQKFCDEKPSNKYNKVKYDCEKL